MRLLKNKYFLLFLLILSALFLASINFPHGNFEDVDVIEIIKSAWKFPAEGYGPSRSWGFPMYELFLYPTIQHFGLNGAKVESVVFYVLSGLLFFKLLLYLTKNVSLSFLGSLAFLVHPISVVTSSAISSTSQEIFFALLSITFFFRYFYEQKRRHLFWMVLFCGFATATRQDYLMLALSLATTLLFLKKLKWDSFLLALFVYGTAVLGPYILFYGVEHFTHLSLQFMGNETFARKIPRAILGYMAVLGLPILFLGFLFGAKYLPHPKELKAGLLKNPAGVLFCSAVFFYFIRFAMLPDKLEYMWVIFPLFLILVFTHIRQKSFLIPFLIAVAIPDFLQIHLFKREGANIKLNIGFSPGAVAQSRSERLRNEYRFFGDYEATVARVAREKFGCQKHLWYLADTPDNDYCIVVPEEMLRFWNPDRLSEGVDRKRLLERKIIVFDFPDNRGWRQFFQFTPWKPLNPADFRLISR
ncbi:MAG: hypothetical protein Q7T03_08505 [Deltaproteobacteria bacterium]|nr:hypothetical protein [Deltaproteobacteria bacterium]